MSERLIMHIDLDAFFASIEQRDHPEYQGRPLVVGAKPGRRGVVATCSYEARRYGVRSAMPISEAARRLPPEAVYLRPDINRYGEVSQQIMTALQSLSPVVEKVSVDEAFLDITGMERLIGDPASIGQQAKQLIHDQVGLTASVGIGPNRLIAKLASDYQKPDGLTVVSADQVEAFLNPLPLTVLRGLGNKSAPILQRLGLRTVADVRRLSLLELRRQLGNLAGTNIYQQAQGIASNRVDDQSTRKSISKETTFDRDITDPAILRESLHWSAQEVGYVARQEQRKGSLVTLKIRFRGFDTHTRSRSLTTPTSADQEIFNNAWELYRNETWDDQPVRLIGLGISGWDGADDEPERQPDLFGDPAPVSDERQDRLYQTLDEVSGKFGRHAIRLGSKRVDSKSGSGSE
ncbi:MAG: DNA polymerase IV [Candidatus Thiodiazotropha taylori]|nr:DNA polymerase IV [Candidatus Thiodiazotropha taylori]MCG8108928.1 DNA polymerase IV [Candidatus Thiodiazotropha taylori]MCG8112766.1 DNA polymerase IV [Candidatus Thiodiazotropha taylori]MCW4281264.1 DNA polymerase IV [Candidatus Thiodiazotropha taylori]MCW4285124.1 DNA polymerase IV [Candidatus Thiodiazotropha taylori]